MILPLFRCADCQDAELLAWWDSMTEAVIRAHRFGLLQGLAIGGIAVGLLVVWVVG